MSISLDDLKPKSFKVNVKGIELDCKPLRLSHALMLSNISDTFQNPKAASKEDMKKAESNMDELIGELIPELVDAQLDVGSILQLISQMMETIQPADNKELAEKGVKFDTDPKVERTG